MNTAELQPHELMQLVASFLESHNIPYRVVGSLASMAYGEPRFTNDFDFASALREMLFRPLDEVLDVRRVGVAAIVLTPGELAA